MAGDEDEPPAIRRKRGRRLKLSYEAAAELAWQYYEQGMKIDPAARLAVEVLGYYGSVDLRGLVAGGRGPLPTDGLLPNTRDVQAGLSMRCLSEYSKRAQRPAKWGEGGIDEFTPPPSPRYLLASNDTVVQQVAAKVRKRKKLSLEKK